MTVDDFGGKGGEGVCLFCESMMIDDVIKECANDPLSMPIIAAIVATHPRTHDLT